MAGLIFTMWFIPFSFTDLVDILMVATLMYGIYKGTRGTNAPYIITGIIVLYLLFVIVRALNMVLLSSIMGEVVSVGVIAILIIFQPEIRHFLQVVGNRWSGLKFLSGLMGARPDQDTDMTPIVAACMDMAATKTGALIAICQKDNLEGIVENGIMIDGKVSMQLIKNIFSKNTPLHDGAIIINSNRIIAAKCILPLTQYSVDNRLGTRHRAALGLSDTTDAIIIVISEENGQISIAKESVIETVEPSELLSKIKYLVSMRGYRREMQNEISFRN